MSITPVTFLTEWCYCGQIRQSKNPILFLSFTPPDWKLQFTLLDYFEHFISYTLAFGILNRLIEITPFGLKRNLEVRGVIAVKFAIFPETVRGVIAVNMPVLYSPKKTVL